MIFNILTLTSPNVAAQAFGSFAVLILQPAKGLYQPSPLPTFACSVFCDGGHLVVRYGKILGGSALFSHFVTAVDGTYFFAPSEGWNEIFKG